MMFLCDSPYMRKVIFLFLCLQSLPLLVSAKCAYYLPDSQQLFIPQVQVDTQAQFSVQLALQGENFVLQNVQPNTDTANCLAYFENQSGIAELPKVNIDGYYFQAQLSKRSDSNFQLTQFEPLEVAFGLSSNRPAADFNLPVIASNTPANSLQAVRAFPNLSFSQPVFLTHAPGDNRLFMVEQNGRIVAFANQDSTSEFELVLDIQDLVLTGGEQGLLGVAFDPDYLNNQQFYVYYSKDNPVRSVIARYQMMTDGSGLADPNSEKILLEIEQPYSNHNGGMLAFGADNMLYIALGDGGSGGDPLNHGQNRTTLLGSILRIDPHGEPYAIPEDNPFASATDGSRPEIWAYGLRNPYRFSFDRETGELWAGDVGQNSFEEIDLIVAGGNYGWRLFEGNEVYNNPTQLPASNYIAPVIDYGRDLGVSVTGGYVYRGQALPQLRGAYIYGDFGSGRIWALRRNDDNSVENEQIAEVAMISSFGEDAQGELYIVSYQGAIYRLQASTAEEPPTLLSETGLFENTTTLTPSTALIEYDVNSPFWSDGSQKRRWFYTPDKIQFSTTGPWEFPVGSVLVKQIDFAQNNLPAWRLETRLMLRQDTGWAAYTYKWNTAQTDAELLSGGLLETVKLQTANGEHEQDYYYPSRAECLRCHNTAAGMALGLNSRQINRDFTYAETIDNQLRAFNQAALFDINIGAHEQYSAMVNPYDTEMPLGERARSYLDTNCAVCHLPGGPTPVSMDLRYGISVSDMHIINQIPEGLSNNDMLLVEPENAQQSLLWQRMQTLSNQRMPPLGSLVVDEAGVSLIQKTIDAIAK